MQRVTLVRYTAKPDRADENETLARAVFADLRTAAPDNPHIFEEPRFNNRPTRPITHWGIQGAQASGPLAVPGKYTVKLTVDGQSFTQAIEVLKDIVDAVVNLGGAAATGTAGYQVTATSAAGTSPPSATVTWTFQSVTHNVTWDTQPAGATVENIGARRLHTVMSTLMEDLLFELPDYPHKRIVYDATTVKDRLGRIVNDDDLRRYIL